MLKIKIFVSSLVLLSGVLIVKKRFLNNMSKIEEYETDKDDSSLNCDDVEQVNDDVLMNDTQCEQMKESDDRTSNNDENTSFIHSFVNRFKKGCSRLKNTIKNVTTPWIIIVCLLVYDLIKLIIQEYRKKIIDSIFDNIELTGFGIEFRRKI